MKQIAKTPQILERLRAAYGPDANLDDLAVFQIIAVTTLPLRKAAGIFKGARLSLSLLSELAASVNAESIPVQVMHDNKMLPVGRFFFGEVKEDELVGLVAIDGKSHADVVVKMDNGTIDQVSVGFAPKRLTCSGCGFNFMDPKNVYSLYTLTCDDDHTIGQDGIFAHVDGLEQFFELSLVGKGAAQGARIVGPSDALFQNNEQYRLAASANPGLHAVRLSPTVKDPPIMNVELAVYEAKVTELATVQATLATVTSDRDAKATKITELEAQVAQLTTDLAAAKDTDAEKAKADAAAALTALKTEAKTILTACGKADTAIPDDITAVLALITEHRKAFAAAIPPGGASNAADTKTNSEPARPTAAFRAPA